MTPEVAVIENGPLWVRGGIPIEASDGFEYEVRQRVTLCRCGHSRNKPFCDGSHVKVPFREG
jgi:CDGSH-type Zn-finger protein